MTPIASFASRNFDVQFPAALAWIAFWILGSVAYRVWRGKPLLVHPAHDAIFTENWASGCSNKNVLTRLGGARRCLHVVVTPSELHVRPHFPFSLLFLPEIYDLELRIPKAHIRSVEQRRTFLGDALLVSYGAPGEPDRSVQLWLHHSQEFCDAFRQCSVV